MASCVICKTQIDRREVVVILGKEKGMRLDNGRKKALKVTVLIAA